MVAVSNPSVLDSSLCRDSEGKEDTSKMIVHAYGAGNEGFSLWADKNNDNNDSPSPSQQSYQEKKEKAAEFLYRSVSRALDIPESEVKERSDVAMIGSPYTHMVSGHVR
jgi:hypothetical protein